MCFKGALAFLLLLLMLSRLSPVYGQTITPQLNISRTICNAPCIVVADMEGTTDTDPSVTKPIHHLTYCFDSGEDTGEFYSMAAGYSSRVTKTTSKDKFCGAPRWGHIYETPGVYQITGCAKRKTGPNDEACLTSATITVNGFSAAQTECIAPTGGSFAECPYTEGEGAIHSTNDSFNSAAGACLARRDQCLFQSGQTFSVTGTVTMGGSGKRIGRYGTDGRYLTRGNPGSLLINLQADDVAITHFDWIGFAGVNTINIRADNTGDIDHALVAYSKVVGPERFLTSGSFNEGTAQGRFSGLFSNEVIGCLSYCVYHDSAEMMVVDNVFDGTTATHNQRIKHAKRWWYHGNFMRGTDSAQRSVMTVRAWDWTAGGNDWAEQLFASDNVFVGRDDWPIQIGASGASGEDTVRHRNHIFERNYTYLEANPGGVVDVCYKLENSEGTGADVTENFTLRANICDTTLGQGDTSMIGGRSGNGDEFYHNTLYSNSPDAGVLVASTNVCEGNNNLAWHTQGSGTRTLYAGGACANGSAGNWATTSDGQAGVSQLSGCPLLNCSGAMPDDTSFGFDAVNSVTDGLRTAAVSAPILCDFFNNQLDASVGAVSHLTTPGRCTGSSQVPPPEPPPPVITGIHPVVQ